MMVKGNWEYFNCSQEHEINYMASKFIDSTGAKEKIKELCKNGTINNSTHGEVERLLINAGLRKNKGEM